MDTKELSNPETTLLPGLFDLTTRQPQVFAADHETGRLSVGMATFADDFLTGLTITAFGREPFHRLTICRPSALGITALRRDKHAARTLLREDPVRQQLLDVGIAPDAYPVWSDYVRRRTAHFQSLVESMPVSPGAPWVDRSATGFAPPPAPTERRIAASAIEQLAGCVITVEYVVSVTAVVPRGALA